MQESAPNRSYLSMPITWASDETASVRDAGTRPPASRYRLRGPRRPIELTVGSYYYDVRDCRAPMVRLRGLWLEQAGLLTGSRLSISIETCKLTITVIAPPPRPPEKKPKRKPRWQIDRERMLSTIATK